MMNDGTSKSKDFLTTQICEWIKDIIMVNFFLKLLIDKGSCIKSPKETLKSMHNVCNARKGGIPSTPFHHLLLNNSIKSNKDK